MKLSPEHVGENRVPRRLGGDAGAGPASRGAESGEVVSERPAGDTVQGVQWVKDEDCKNCVRCKVQFSWRKRKHHCRRCGNIFCARCSGYSVDVARIGRENSKGKEKKCRVCTDCALVLGRPRDSNADHGLMASARESGAPLTSEKEAKQVRAPMHNVREDSTEQGGEDKK